MKKTIMENHMHKSMDKYMAIRSTVLRSQLRAPLKPLCTRKKTGVLGQLKKKQPLNLNPKP